MFSNKIGKNEMNNFFGVEVGVGCRLIYSGTPPYALPIITATLFLHEKKRSQSFSFLKSPFNTTTPLIRPIFHGPKVVVLTGFHCMFEREYLRTSQALVMEHQVLQKGHKEDT